MAQKLTLAPGTKLPDGSGTPRVYLVERLLAEGGMADIYIVRVTDRTDGPHVMKVLRHENHVPTFMREAWWMSQQHRGVVPLYWVDHTIIRGESRPIVIMPYLREGSLLSRLRSRTYSRLDVVAWITACANTLKGISCVHRDLKPENILFFGGAPLIADFGLAVHGTATERLAWGEILTERGSPPYMSPEQHRNIQDIDWKSDAYTLALIFYELWTGDLPYAQNLSPTHLFYRKYDGLELGGIDNAAAIAFCIKALRYSRAERHQSWSAYLAGLDQIRTALTAGSAAAS